MLTAGAVASCVASAATTPFDVVKTRIATGLLPPGTSALRAIAAIGSSEGSSALFAGMSSRVLWSALYGGIGLTIYDICKAAMEPATTVGSAENLS